MKIKKAGSPSNGSFPPSLSTEAPKFNFPRREWSFSQKKLFDDCFQFWRLLERLKNDFYKRDKEENKKKKRKNNKNGEGEKHEQVDQRKT